MQQNEIDVRAIVINIKHRYMFTVAKGWFTSSTGTLA